MGHLEATQPCTHNIYILPLYEVVMLSEFCSNEFYVKNRCMLLHPYSFRLLSGY